MSYQPPILGLSGITPITQSGFVVLSGAQRVIISEKDHVIEHMNPGMEGGVIERIGSQSLRFKIIGFAESGDDFKASMSGQLQGLRTLIIPSTITGNYLYAGDVKIENFNVAPRPGFGYPYYQWVLSAALPASGAVVFPIGIVSGSWLFLFPSQFIDYSQVLPVFASIHPDYSQVLPIGITEHPDYARVLPIGVTEHPDYSRVLPVGVSVHPDYSQVLPLGASIRANYVRIS